MANEKGKQRRRRARKGTIYLLCFSKRYKHAGHYLGWASDLDERLAQHAGKTGARLVAVILEAGMSFECVRTWQGTRDDERRLKNRHDAPRICPACGGERAAKRAARWETAAEAAARKEAA